MSIAFQFTVRDDARPAIAALAAGLRSDQVNPVIGASAVETYRIYLFGLNQTRPNALHGPRTNFYASAARGTHFKFDGDYVVVSINQVGIRQRFYGGTIEPVTKKYLTIPVHPDAYGKRAREFDLELVFGLGGQPYALATKSTRSVSVTLTKTGRISKRLTGRHGEIYYRLVRSVTQKPDPTVLPAPDLVLKNINRDVLDYANRIWQRDNPDRGRTLDN